MVSVSKFLSYLFHPVFAPLVSIYILLQLPIYINFKLTDEFVQFIYAVVLLNLIVSPIFASIYLKRKGFISSMHMENVKERTIPYLISCIFYLFTYYLFLQIEFPQLYLTILKAATFVIISLMILSIMRLKVSAHLAALGGICGMLFIVGILLQLETSLLLMFFLLISGIVASARYALKAHSFIELGSGFCIGFIMQFVAFYYY